jgi:hypothetical protein
LPPSAIRQSRIARVAGVAAALLVLTLGGSAAAHSAVLACFLGGLA